MRYNIAAGGADGTQEHDTVGARTSFNNVAVPQCTQALHNALQIKLITVHAAYSECDCTRSRRVDSRTVESDANADCR